MDRYIDADEYRKRLEMICGDGYTKQVIDIFIDWFMSIAESTESADVAPVIHAHWIRDTKYRAYWFCSNCGSFVQGLAGEHYCRYCGAKMDEVEQ